MHHLPALFTAHDLTGVLPLSTIKARASSLEYETGKSRAQCLNAVCQDAGYASYQHYLQAARQHSPDLEALRSCAAPFQVLEAQQA